MYELLWTRHGYWMGDGASDNDTQPIKTEYCGGPDWCSKCRAEKDAHINQPAVSRWIQWTEWVEHVLKTHPVNTRDKYDLRLGQKLMNGLGNYSMWIQNMLTASAHDPFYNDKRIGDFLFQVDRLFELSKA